MMEEAHEILERDFNIPHDCEESPNNYLVMLETDFDPMLVKKMGW